jgi:anti-sigma B factor antagonist
LLFNQLSVVPMGVAGSEVKVKTVGDPDTPDPGSPVNLTVRVISTGDRAARVLVVGELDLASSEKLDRALTQALTDADEVVLDLSEVSFIDSTGLSTILSGVSTSQLNGGKLTISSSLPPQARKLFELVGMQDALPIVDE